MRISSKTLIRINKKQHFKERIYPMAIPIESGEIKGIQLLDELMDALN